MEMTKTLSMAASPLALSLCVREQFGTAPNASRQGSAMSFAGYPIPGATSAATAHATQTLAAVRKDDARVPPRGRPL